jgi:ketosteroid isomerase-like protein
MTTESARAVIDRHNETVARGDVDLVAADYTYDAVLITADGVRRGHEAIIDFFRRVGAELAGAAVTITAIVDADDVVYLEWHARAEDFVVRDGVDTFVVEGDLIRAQTVRYTRERVMH